MSQLAAKLALELELKVAQLENALRDIARDYAPVAFASSLGAEDMVITDALVRAQLDVEVFTLETGRLHAETLALVDTIRARYGADVQLYRPDAAAVADYVERFGRDAFYESVELRQRCCAIRKVEPLRRALAGKRAWITGLRRSQSITRRTLPEQELDREHGIQKFNPLAAWSESEVWNYLRAFDVPYNPLHDRGFRSIGCEPCTRPTTVGEDVRAGRWWWEDEQSKECGLHKAASSAIPVRNA